MAENAIIITVVSPTGKRETGLSYPGEYWTSAHLEILEDECKMANRLRLPTCDRCNTVSCANGSTIRRDDEIWAEYKDGNDKNRNNSLCYECYSRLEINIQEESLTRPTYIRYLSEEEAPHIAYLEAERAQIVDCIDSFIAGIRKLIGDNLEISAPCDVCSVEKTFEVSIDKNTAGDINHLVVCVNGHAEIY